MRFSSIVFSCYKSDVRRAFLHSIFSRPGSLAVFVYTDKKSPSLRAGVAGDSLVSLDPCWLRFPLSCSAEFSRDCLGTGRPIRPAQVEKVGQLDPAVSDHHRGDEYNWLSISVSPFFPSYAVGILSLIVLSLATVARYTFVWPARGAQRM